VHAPPRQECAAAGWVRSARPCRQGGPIRIAFVHSFYVSRNPSGENRVVEAEMRALSAAGHDVALVAARTDDLERAPLYPIGSALRVATGRGRSPARPLAAFEPDVVHVHNLFPNFGSSWARSVRAPIVATLHNFRPVCANGALFRDGATCTECVDRGSSVPALRYACYRGSRVATLPIAVDDRSGLGLRPLLGAARRVIVLSEVARGVYRRAGIPEDAIVVAPNFLDRESEPPFVEVPETSGGDAPWLYVGRLGPEKGIERLVRAWPRDRSLIVVGDGPDLAAVRRAAQGKRVDVAGLRDRGEVLEVMSRAVGLVFPSVCYENFPLVYAEALAVGLPVLAWEPNVVAAMVRRDGTGLATTWEHDLERVLDQAGATFATLRRRCREIFDTTLSESAYIRRAERLYGEVVTEAGVAAPTRALSEPRLAPR
jgi:glycosyltransferase involved in cell wall biosynthesis